MLLSRVRVVWFERCGATSERRSPSGREAGVGAAGRECAAPPQGPWSSQGVGHWAVCPSQAISSQSSVRSADTVCFLSGVSVDQSHPEGICMRIRGMIN